MANKKNHRQFGLIRKLPSGRFQASYLGPDGKRIPAPETYDNKTDAATWLTLRESEILRGEWTNPALGRTSFVEYSTQWQRDHVVAPRTAELYESQLRLHIVPYLGDIALADISTETIRWWRRTILENGRSEILTAKCYRLVRAIMNTAVTDGRILKNPCRIKGAGKEDSPERPVASVEQVFALADAMPARFRQLILVTALAGLRWGEVIGLRRSDVDLDVPYVRVAEPLSQPDSGAIKAGKPKSEAGKRTVALPSIVVDGLREHLAEYVGAETTDLVFTGPRGAVLRRSNWRKMVKWRETVRNVGLPATFRFHDLRHTGNHMASSSGASTRELMRRLGHSSTRAAMKYQHATDERDRELAQRLDQRVRSIRKVSLTKQPASGERHASGHDHGSPTGSAEAV